MSNPPVSYPLDRTGTAVSNKIENELHTLTEVNSAPYRVILPIFTPFYLDNLILEHVDMQGVVTPLNINVDYAPSMLYAAATRSTGKFCYGGLTIQSTLPQGTIRITSYQTIGGDFSADRDYVYGLLLDEVYNPRTCYWDQITNVQELFPPFNHEHPAGDLNGYQVIVDKLTAIANAIAAQPDTFEASLLVHEQQTENVHGFPPGGLPAPASDQEVIAHAVVDKTVTLRQVLYLLGLASL